MARDSMARDTYDALYVLSTGIMKSHASEIPQVKGWQTAWNK